MVVREISTSKAVWSNNLFFQFLFLFVIFLVVIILLNVLFLCCTTFHYDLLLGFVSIEFSRDTYSSTKFIGSVFVFFTNSFNKLVTSVSYLLLEVYLSIDKVSLFFLFSHKKSKLSLLLFISFDSSSN